MIQHSDPALIGKWMRGYAGTLNTIVADATACTDFQQALMNGLAYGVDDQKRRLGLALEAGINQTLVTKYRGRVNGRADSKVVDGQFGFVDVLANINQLPFEVEDILKHGGIAPIGSTFSGRIKIAPKNGAVQVKNWWQTVGNLNPNGYIMPIVTSKSNLEDALTYCGIYRVCHPEDIGPIRMGMLLANQVCNSELIAYLVDRIIGRALRVSAEHGQELVCDNRCVASDVAKRAWEKECRNLSQTFGKEMEHEASRLMPAYKVGNVWVATNTFAKLSLEKGTSVESMKMGSGEIGFRLSFSRSITLEKKREAGMVGTDRLSIIGAAGYTFKVYSMQISNPRFEEGMPPQILIAPTPGVLSIGSKCRNCIATSPSTDVGKPATNISILITLEH